MGMDRYMESHLNPCAGYKAEIERLRAALGTIRDYKPAINTCSWCDGSGSDRVDRFGIRERCPNCGGSGETVNIDALQDIARRALEGDST